jgi:putative nucleotidyltransferase with HDIG domain
MIKKVKVKELKPGMYIHDFNCSWIRHPFLTNSMKVKDAKVIRKISGYGIRDVYIDTDKGPDVSDATSEGKADQKILTEINHREDVKHVPVEPVPLKKELGRAREIKREAKQAVRSLMDEVRFGKQIETEKVEKVVNKMVDSIFRNQDALISLGRIKQTDEYTYMHSMSVCALMIAFGKQLGFDNQMLREVGVGAMLHDIGKMKVPAEILAKKGGLTDDEFEMMKKHVSYSKDLLEQTPGIAELSVMVASQHHERLDGKGYPHGLKGKEISIYGQAAAIADVYDAMTSQRCYQRRFEPTEVLKKLHEWSGSYNTELVEQFVRCIGIYPVGSLVMLESGLLGVVLDQGKENLLEPVVRIVFNTKKAKHVMPPYDVDLSKSGNDRACGYELPDAWDIQPEMYL